MCVLHNSRLNDKARGRNEKTWLTWDALNPVTVETLSENNPGRSSTASDDITPSQRVSRKHLPVAQTRLTKARHLVSPLKSTLGYPRAYGSYTATATATASTTTTAKDITTNSGRASAALASTFHPISETASFEASNQRHQNLGRGREKTRIAVNRNHMLAVGVCSRSSNTNLPPLITTRAS